MRLCNEIGLEAHRKYLEKIDIHVFQILSCGTNGNVLFMVYFIWRSLGSTSNSSRVRAGGILFFTLYTLSSKTSFPCIL